MTLLTWYLTGLAALGPGGWLVARGIRTTGRFGRFVFIGLGALLVIVGATIVGYMSWSASGDRSEISIEISERIDYERFMIDDAVVHWATIDIGDGVLGQCLVPVLSLPDHEGKIDADVGTGFVEKESVDLAVNVAYFYPFDEYPEWSAYPRVGEEVTAIGVVVDDGVSHGLNLNAELYLGVHDEAPYGTVGPFPTNLEPGMWVEPGARLIIEAGEVVIDDTDMYPRLCRRNRP